MAKQWKASAGKKEKNDVKDFFLLLVVWPHQEDCFLLLFFLFSIALMLASFFCNCQAKFRGLLSFKNGDIVGGEMHTHPSKGPSTYIELSLALMNVPFWWKWMTHWIFEWCIIVKASTKKRHFFLCLHIKRVVLKGSKNSTAVTASVFNK